MYQYRALVTKVYDGDTITVDIDLGFGTWQKGQKIRLYGIDTPEVRGTERAAGLVSRDWLRNAILDTIIVVKTHKDKKGKYGRWLGDIYLNQYDDTSLNVIMVELGLAEVAEY